MAYTLSSKSQSKLLGVHPALVGVINKAIGYSKQDFSVLYGVRSAGQQNELYQRGRTTRGPIVTYKDGYKKKSNHQPKEDGYGYAVDLMPYPVDWEDWSKFEAINDAVQKAASELGVIVEWGGEWKMRDGAHWEYKGVR